MTSKKLKILILTFYYKPDISAGSFRMEGFVEALSKKIKDKKNIEIDILTSMPNRYGNFQSNIKHYENITDNIKIRRINIFKHKNRLLTRAASFLKYFINVLYISKKNDYDIIFSTSSLLFTGFLGALTAKIKHAELYLDIRDIFTDSIKDMLPNYILFFLMPILKIIEKFTIRRADKINLVSRGFYEYFKDRFPEKSFSFFTNGIDKEFIGVNFEKTKRNEKKIITYIGNIGEGQGLHKIIPYIAKNMERKYLFQIIGDGGGLNALKENLKKMDSSNVILYKPVTREKLIEFYKQSDYLFLHLNDYEAFKKVLPSKIFEYAAVQKPIIAGVSGFCRRFIETHINNHMIFKPCDPDDFIEKFKNSEFSEKIERKEFIEKFQRDKIMNLMAEDFLSLIK